MFAMGERWRARVRVAVRTLVGAQTWSGRYCLWAIIGTVSSTVRQRVSIIVVFPAGTSLPLLWYYPGTCEGPGYSRGQQWQLPASRLCSATKWKVTEHHFYTYNSCQFRCVSLLRMLKNAFWDKMHVPRTCSVERFVIAHVGMRCTHRAHAQ